MAVSAWWMMCRNSGSHGRVFTDARGLLRNGALGLRPCYTASHVGRSDTFGVMNTGAGGSTADNNGKLLSGKYRSPGQDGRSLDLSSCQFVLPKEWYYLEGTESVSIARRLDIQQQL